MFVFLVCAERILTAEFDGRVSNKKPSQIIGAIWDKEEHQTPLWEMQPTSPDDLLIPPERSNSTERARSKVIGATEPDPGLNF